MPSYSLSPARIFRYCGVSFLLGIVFASYTNNFALFLLVVGIGGVVSFLLSSNSKFNLVLLLIICSFIAGFFRYYLVGSSSSDSLSVPFLSSLATSLREKVKLNLEKNLPFPEVYIAESLLLGHRNNMPQWLYQKFIQSGLAHLVAVSGLHLMIIVSVLNKIGKKLLLPFWLNYGIIAAIILLFVALADFSPSVVRAAIMALILLIGQLAHRPYNSTNAIIAAAVVMTFANPNILKDSLGFQLSFLSCLGIIYLYPIIANYSFWKRPIFQKELFMVKEAFLLSESALIATAPWILYRTGHLSLAGLVTTVLVVPLLPYLMIGGVLIALLEFIFHWGAMVFAWWELIGLKYLFSLVNIFSTIPMLSGAFPGILVMGYYTLLIYFIKKKQQTIEILPTK
ncbi:ComEC/Rec2 family competence protein [bacterium]|nr:ComEC/Rec2 family competence protein [bacterium]